MRPRFLIVLLLILPFTLAQHKDLGNLSVPEWSCFFLLFLGIMFGNAAGVGGAGIIMPTLMIIYRFEILESSALSNTMICVGFIIKFCFNVFQKHPNYDKPIINYDSASLMLPCSLIGVKLGILIHDITPKQLLFLFLTIVLTFLAYKTLLQGLQIHQSESAKAKKEGKTIPLLSKEENQLSLGLPQDVPKEFLESEAQLLPADKCAYILATMALFVLSMEIEGAKGTSSFVGIIKCSAGYWSSYLLFISACVVITVFVARNVRAKYIVKLQYNYVHDGDVEWTSKKVAEYSAYGLLSGILSSIFGIGGGMILTPLLSQLGMIPEVVASTGGLFVMITTGSSGFLLISHNYWNFQYGILTILISIVASLLSIKIIKEVLKKTGKASIIIFLLAGIIFFSGISISCFGLYEEYQKYGSLFASESWRVKNYCS